MNALVTGGGGFLGRAVVERLLARGDTVKVLGRNRYPEVEALGAEGVVGDLADAWPVEALRGVDVVFHVAGLAGMWGPREDYVRTNLTGTVALLDAARRYGVKRFVYTSSPSVTFHGHDEEGVSEAQTSYPERFLFWYPETKAAAEKAVLGANGPGFATTALRPHLIYGERDPHLLPRLIRRHQAGRLRRIGDGTNRVALTYVENGAVAHLQAADALAEGSPNAGKAYFITDGEPVRVWDWLNEVFTRLGLGPVRGSVPKGVAMTAGGVAEWVWRTFALSGDPPVTRFTVSQIATSHWYDLSAARADFGYAPVVNPADAVDRTVAAIAKRLRTGTL